MTFLWFFLTLLTLALLTLCSLAGPGRLAPDSKLLQTRYAHRGLHDISQGVPENSLEAFRRAANAGFGAELDVHLTRDGRLAVLHDSNLQRACGVAAAVEDLDATQLANCRLFGTDHGIPFLEDILPLFAGRAPLLIEIKTHRRNGPALAAALCQALEGQTGPFLVESFDPRALRALRKLQPDLPRGQLSKNFHKDHSCGIFPAWLLGHLFCNFLSRPDFVAYRFADRKCWSLRLCHRLFGMGVMLWTILSQEDLQTAEAESAAGIFEGFLPNP